MPFGQRGLMRTWFTIFVFKFPLQVFKLIPHRSGCIPPLLIPYLMFPAGQDPDVLFVESE